jgi:high-affinity iron transporter
VILLLFAAGLLSRAAHEFAEAGLLPALVERVWDASSVLPESSGLGAVLRALFGYTEAPSLLELLVYVGYIALVVVLVRTGIGASVTPSVRPAEERTA